MGSGEWGERKIILFVLLLLLVSLISLISPDLI
jgi:hypothetical protein